MDISGWTVAQIMQLPDCMFGQHRLIGRGKWQTSAGVLYAMSPFALPDPCIVWGVSIFGVVAAGYRIILGVRLGTSLPANTAEFLALDEIFPDVLGADDVSGYFDSAQWPAGLSMRTRIYLVTGGQKVVSRHYTFDIGTTLSGYLLDVSAVPTEIPAWQI